MKWRATATLETLLGVGLVVLLGLVIPGHWGLLDLQPHPLWFVVLAIALWYGVPAGYWVGGLAALTYVTLLLLRPATRGQVPALEELIQPYLLFVGGIVVGELARVQRQRLRAVEQAHQEATSALAALQTSHQQVVAANEALGQRIVGQEASVNTLYALAKRLSLLRTEAIYPAVLDLTGEVLRAESCALYLWHDGAFRLWEGRPQANTARPQTLTIDAGLGAEVVRQGRVVSVRDLAVAEPDVAIETQGPLLAGPLFGSGRQVLGILVVESLDFWHFNPTTVRLAGLLLDWASTALQQALWLEAIRGGQEQALTTAPSATIHLLQVEIARAQHYGYPLAVAIVGFGGQAVDRPKRLAAFTTVARQRLGEGALIGDLAEGDRCLVILPTLTPVEARGAVATVAALLPKQAADDEQPAPCVVGVAALSEVALLPEALLSGALADLQLLPSSTMTANGRYATAHGD